MEQKEPELWERQMALDILGALESRGFSDLGKFLEDDIIEAARPFFTTARLQAAREERVKVLHEVEEAFRREYCTRIECIDPKEIIQSIKNNI